MTIDDMWQRLAQHQPFADARGYGPAWAEMCRERTPDAAVNAARAARAAGERARAEALTGSEKARLEAAVAAEREACAEWSELVAREIDDTNGTATYIAKGIRARGKND